MAEYIAREALLNDIAAAVDHGGMGRVVGQTLMRYAKRIPAADVAPVVHGRWIEKKAPAVRIYFECSNCSAHENKHTAIQGYYCWRCGAKMDGGADNAAN